MHAPPMQDSGRTKPNKNIASNKVLGLHAIGEQDCLCQILGWLNNWDRRIILDLGFEAP